MVPLEHRLQSDTENLFESSGTKNQ